MTEREVHEVLKQQVCKELEEIAEKIRKSGTMSEGDLDKLDKLYHTKKDILATHGMENPEEYEGFSGDMSGRRGRSSVTGRFVSRDGGQSYAEGYSQGYSEAMSQRQSGQSYSDGYSQGYSEAMSQRQSGHYPMMYPPEMRYRY